MKTRLRTNSTNESLISKIDTLFNPGNTNLHDNEEIIDHSDLSEMSCRIINDLVGANIDGGQCFGIATLGTLAMKNGKEGRVRFIAYLLLMKEIANIMDILNIEDKPHSVLDLISKICKNEFPAAEQSFAESDSDQKLRNGLAKIRLDKIKEIDPEYQLLRDVPAICLTHYIYNYQENMPKFGELTETNSPIDDQNFILIQRALANIGNNNKFSAQLSKLFPDYQTLNGQSLANDFKRIQTVWQNPNNYKNVTSQNNTTSLLSVGLYDTEEIRTYFNCLRRAIDNGNIPSNENIQLLTYTTTHTTGISFNNNEKKWYITDSLELTPKNLYHGLTESEVADHLRDCLSNDKCAGFVALLYANTNVHNSIISKLKNDRQWRGIQNFNRDNLIAIGGDEYYKRVILNFVAAANNDEMTRKIIASKNFHFYINETNRDFLNYIINKNDGSLDIILPYITNIKVIGFIVNEIIKKPLDQVNEFFAKHPAISPVGIACACDVENVPVVELLLNYLNKDNVNFWGGLALRNLIQNDCILSYTLSKGIFNKLLAIGVDINALDENGKTPLMCLCEMQSESFIAATNFQQIVELFLSHGADIYRTDIHGKDALYYAANSDESAIQYLLGKYNNINFLVNRANAEINDEADFLVLENVLSMLYKANPDIIADVNIKIKPGLYFRNYDLIQNICDDAVKNHPESLVTFLIKNRNINHLPGAYIYSLIHRYPEILYKLFQSIKKNPYPEVSVTNIIQEKILEKCKEAFPNEDFSTASWEKIEKLYLQTIPHDESAVTEKQNSAHHDTKLNHRTSLKQHDKITMFKSRESRLSRQKQERAQTREAYIYNLRRGDHA